MLKVGNGYDLHRLSTGRKMIIGGVEIPSSVGCLAHSDGDVLIHAIIDSLVSPLGIGDIGTLFPDNDPQYKDISSLALLEEIYSKYLSKINILNIDTVIILDSPKIAGYIPDIKNNIARILKIDTDCIGIKGKTSENTRLYTIECHVITLLEVSHSNNAKIN